MLEELLAIDLLLITSLLAHISYHCFQFQKERPQILESLNGKTTELFDILTEGGDLLADLCDIVEPIQPSNPVKQAASSIPELLLTSLLSRTPMPNLDGAESERQGRTIYEAEQQETPEETGDQHSSSGDSISGG